MNLVFILTQIRVGGCVFSHELRSNLTMLYQFPVPRRKESLQILELEHRPVCKGTERICAKHICVKVLPRAEIKIFRFLALKLGFMASLVSVTLCLSCAWLSF